MRESNIDKEKICRECPIFRESDSRCNPNLWLNPETNEVSIKPLIGYKRGCGCILTYKWRNSSSHCNAGKW